MSSRVGPPAGPVGSLERSPSGLSTDSTTVRSTLGNRYRALLQIGRILVGTRSLADLYEAIHRETSRVLEASGFYISLYDPGRDLATIVFLADKKGARRVDIRYRGSESEVIRTGRPLLVNDRLRDRGVLVLGESTEQVARAAICAPLLHDGEVLGTISAQSYEPDAYTEEDLKLLRGIADISSVVIDNARHIAELERRRREAEQIEEIGRALASSLDATEVLGKVIDAVLDVLAVDSASVWRRQDAGEIVEVAASGGVANLPTGLSWDLSGVLAERLLEERVPVILDDLPYSTLVPAHLRRHLRSASGVGVPLIVGGEVAGVLSAGSRAPRDFSEDDTGVLQRLASQASVAIENARLHARLRALSLTDPLTDLPNRRRLQIHLDGEVAAARRGRPLAVAVFDLDHFKQYNDTLGHVAGDDILRAFAQILDDENRAMNLVARYGGDEFVTVLSDSHVDGARRYVRRVVQRISGDRVMGRHGVEVSVGVAEFDFDVMKTSDDVIAAADADMYRRKNERISRQAGSG